MWTYFVIKTRISPQQGAPGGGSECGNRISGANFLIAFQTNYGSILLSFRDMTVRRTTGDVPMLATLPSQIWPLRRANNEWKEITIWPEYYSTEERKLSKQLWITPLTFPATISYGNHLFARTSAAGADAWTTTFGWHGQISCYVISRLRIDAVFCDQLLRYISDIKGKI